MFLALFWAYVGQPDGHVGWVTLMPFASINPTDPRTNLWNFGDNCSAFWGSWKTQFFWVGHFEFFSTKKKKMLYSYSNFWDTKNFFEILMITLISSKKLGVCNNMRYTVKNEKVPKLIRTMLLHSIKLAQLWFIVLQLTKQSQVNCCNFWMKSFLKE